MHLITNAILLQLARSYFDDIAGVDDDIDDKDDGVPPEPEPPGISLETAEPPEPTVPELISERKQRKKSSWVW